MRWPLSRRPRAAAPVTVPAEAPAGRQPRLDLELEPHPGRSRPRADWAHLESLRPVSASAAPLTFHGERFGRSVAGARPLIRPPLPRRSGSAVAGVLLDVAAVETIVPPEPPAMPAIPATSATASVGRKPGVPVAQHRKPAVAATTVDPLVFAQETFPWSAPAPRPQPLPDVDMSWTPETGFRHTRPGRRRPTAAEPEVVEPTGTANESSAHPQLRFLPAVGRRPVEERPSPPSDVVGAVAAATGVHIGDASIDRSPEAGEQAGDLGAVAFTRHGVVHLPADLGPLDVPSVRAVLAHELTHVAQHRRRGGDVPAEDTPEGRALEAEARAVQAAFQPGGPVVPAFRRHHPGTTRREGPVGVQRLAADEDPYAWQERPDVREAAETHALWGDRGWSRTGDGAQAEAEALRQRHREFEANDKTTLAKKRQARWDELEAEVVRDAQTDAARKNRAYGGLDRAELLDLRAQLDHEMPFEFGFPPGIDPYPGPPLPQPTEEERHRERFSPPRSGRTTGTGRAPAGGPLGRRAPVVGGRGRGRGSHASAGAEETPYEWQEREPTDRQALGALFGGSILATLFGMAVSDTDETASRKAAEADRLTDLLGQRRTREQNLRHLSLQRHHTEAVREQPDVLARGSSARRSPFPIALSDGEINDIRAQVDGEMPLEFHPLTSGDYLARTVETEIDRQGNIGGLTVDRPQAPAPAPPRPPTPPAMTPGERNTTASSTAEYTAAPALAPQPPVALVAPQTTPTPPVVPPEDPATHAVAYTSTGAPTTGAGAGSVLFGAAAGAAVGTGLGRLLDDGDAHNADELMARRVFAAATDVDLDSLTRRLYSRMRRELRTELLVDRERSGSLADMR